MDEGLAGPSPRLPLLAAWSLIGIGAASHYGAYSPFAVWMVALGTAVLAASLFWPKDGRGLLSLRGSRSLTNAVVLGAIAVALVCAIHYPTALYGSGRELIAARRLFLTCVGVTPLCLLAAWAGPDRPQLVNGLVALIFVIGGFTLMAASPNPNIDVWFMLQATAHGLFHGLNMYAQHWPARLGEGTHLYAYLPASTVGLAPFYAAFGDVRVGLVMAIAAAAMLAASVRRGPVSSGIACLIVVSPMATFGIEQSWTEPLVLVALAGMVLSVERGRPRLAVLCLAAALASKQYAWLAIPLAAFWPSFGWRRTLLSVIAATAFMLPWVVAAPHLFYEGVVSSNLAAGKGSNSIATYLRNDSLTLYSVSLRRGLTVPLIGAGSAAAIGAGLSLWRLPRDSYGFALGSAATIGLFDLFNSHSFFNQWWLVLGLIALAAACLPEPETSKKDRRSTVAGTHRHRRKKLIG